MLLDTEKILKGYIGNKNIVINLLKSLERSDYTGAWILSGPEGIGKAKVAKKIIKGLFEINNKDDNLLHPDLFILDKASDGKKFIPVEEVRKISQFLSKTSIIGVYKSVLIDSLSDLNTFGLNSLLKILEEYKFNTSFFLIDHMNTYIPKTINSRCKKIIFKKLSDNEISYLLSNDNDTKRNISEYTILSNGSIGNAYALYKNNALNLHNVICKYFLEKEPVNNNYNSNNALIRHLFKDKKNNSKIFYLLYLMLFRILKITLKSNINLKVSYLSDLEKKVVYNFSSNLEHNQIILLLETLYNRKENTMLFNLDFFSSIHLTLNDIKDFIKKNAR